jgi:hypothetical protein
VSQKSAKTRHSLVEARVYLLRGKDGHRRGNSCFIDDIFEDLNGNENSFGGLGIFISRRDCSEVHTSKRSDLDLGVQE